jgi:23S rRNA (uridine2552-2'-O)-methyltransferase
MAHRRPSSQAWLQRQRRDPYVLAAHREGYRSRAAYKLLELQKRFQLLKPGMSVVELGAAPGGWTQVATQAIQPGGRMVAVDRLAMTPLPPAYIIQGDFLEETTLVTIQERLGGKQAQALLSDMSPDLSGIRVADQARGELLTESAFDFAQAHLKIGGVLVMKIFQGTSFHDIVKQARTQFEIIKVVKPQASRDRSAEHYLVGLGFYGDKR